MVLEIVQTSPMGGKPVILFPQKYFTAYVIGIGPFASQRLWLWLKTLFQSCTVSLLYFTRTWSMQSFRVYQSCVKSLRKCECNVSFRSFHCLVLNLMQFSCEVRDWATRPKVWSRRKLLPVLQRGDPTLQGISTKYKFQFFLARQVLKEMGTWSVPGMTSLCTLRKIPQIR